MYIGNDLRSGRSETYVFTASGSETSVTTSDDSRLINYTVGWVKVWLNGVLLVEGSGKDFQATTGNSITGLAALTANDILVLEANHTFSVSDSGPRSGGTFDGAVIFDTRPTFSKLLQNPDTISANITIASGFSAVAGGPINFTGTVAVNGNLSIV